jgi:isopenicillin-N epimerase
MSIIYLNSGSHSITPPSILEAVQRYQREYEMNPTHGLFRSWGKLWNVQSRLAKFFGADPRDIFLRVNVTEVMNEFVLGTPLPKDSEIAITDLEYGAIVNLVKYRCERDGLAQKIIHLPSTSKEIQALTPDSLLNLILSQLSPRTRMLVCSDVVTFNGLVLPIERLAEETRKRGILLVVDGAHGPGSQDLDFTKMQNVDFYGGNLHKWMLGPKGTSFGWVNPIHQESIQPVQVGWTIFETGPVFDVFGGGSRFAGKMLMNGCRDFSTFFALDDLIQYWETQGAQKIRAEIFARQADLEKKIERLGLVPLSPRPGPLRGPLLAFELPEKFRAISLQLFYDLIEKHGLQVSLPLMQGRSVLRLTPHVYNTPEEHTTAVEILGRVLEIS